MSLRGKHILLGVTGSIAAYKAAVLVRLLIKEGAEVQVLMTPLAKEFISPLTLSTLSSRPILVEFFNPENGQWNSHVSLGLWADAFVVAPATANTLAKMTHGVADNLLLTSYLSARCPVFVAPAMDLDMLAHPATLSSLEVLRSRGVIVIEPASGALASGLEGKGRMEEPEKIVRVLIRHFAADLDCSGKKILVTAGPTFEKIDPVRFIGNYSSGKMGYALADELASRGADVTLVSGPVQIKPRHSSVKVIPVESAAQMFAAAEGCFAEMDAAIFAAAVADFTPADKATQKVKREGAGLTLELIPTLDIAATLGARRRPGQVLVGFALETESGKESAVEKLKKKNLDFVVLNSLQDKGAGFGFDTNKVTLVDTSGRFESFDLKSKREVARDIANKLAACFNL